MTWTLLTQVASSLASLGAVAGALFAINHYHRAVRTRRAEWLSSLHEKFFESNRYAHVRRILDYHEEPAYTVLREAVTTGKHLPVVDEFFRYLNFFELLASLRQLRQISDNEILALFEYDLRMLARHPFIIETLRTQGFERLPKLLKQTNLLASS